MLGDLLGHTLRAIEGNELFGTVERVRALAKSARSGSERDFERLADELSRMPVGAALPVARAFSHFLHLANIAEQHHRIRRRRAYQHDPDAPPQRGSCAEVFQRMLAAGVSPDRLYDAVKTLRIELVLTAHPTEIARRTLVHKYNRIAAALATRDRDDLTAPERDEIEGTLLREVLSAWGTSDVRDARPTPLDEVRSGLIVFEESLWSAVPRYLRGVDQALREATGRGLPIDAAPLTFGSWIGGDRDGNPSVTPDVTRRACLLARWVAVTLYLREIKALRDELSIVNATPESAPPPATPRSLTGSCCGAFAPDSGRRGPGSKSLWMRRAILNVRTISSSRPPTADAAATLRGFARTQRIRRARGRPAGRRDASRSLRSA